jgi:thioredoxin-like negative regulator of GroEL
MLANFDIIAHRFDDAIKELEPVVAKDWRDPVALNNLAWLYQMVGDERALSLAERAYFLAPASAQTEDTLGWILTQRGRAADALDLLQQASAASPSDGATRYHLAVALNDAGHRAEALETLSPIVSASANFDDKAAAQKLFSKISTR